MKEGSFSCYNRNDANHFYRLFKNDSLRFLNFGDRSMEFGNGIHPHFFRGMCCDWLYYDIGLSEDNIARYIGDSVLTLRLTYMVSNLGYDSKGALDEAREKLRNSSEIIDSIKNANSLSALNLQHEQALAQFRLILKKAITDKVKAELENEALRQLKDTDGF